MHTLGTLGSSPPVGAAQADPTGGRRSTGTAATRREAAAALRRVLYAVDAGELTAPAALVHRLEGAALALELQ